MKTKMLTKLMGWCVLAAGVLAGAARAQLPVLASKDFDSDALAIAGTTVLPMTNGWVRYRAAVETNSVLGIGHETHADQVGTIATPLTAGAIRYFCSSAITGHVGTLTFDTALFRGSPADVTPTANMVVFLADTNNRPTGYTPYTNIAITATNWISHTVVFNQYAVTNKYLVLGRDQVESGSYRLQLDSITLRVAPSSMTPTDLALPGNATTWFSNATMSPVLSFDSVGTVTAPVATLWYRYSGAAWSSVAMVASNNTYVLASPIPASGASNRQFEMYAVLDYTDELGPQSFTYPADGPADPVRIDILPVSGNDYIQLQGALTAELALISNQVWRGGMEREAGVTNVATYSFAGPSNTWGSASAPTIPFAAAPTAGQTLPAPTNAQARDVIFSFDETTPTQMSVQFGKYQSFENWGVTSAHGWSLGTGAVLTNSAPSVLPGSSSLVVAGGASAYLQSPAQDGVRSVGFWFRRLSTGTNVVTVTVQKQVGAVWTNAVPPIAGLPSDLFAYRSVTLNDAAATAIRIYADAPALLDNVAVTDLSRATVANPVVTPTPVVATLPADLTVQVVTTNGAAIQSSGVVLHYRYATSGGFTDVTLVPTNGLYRTRDNARIAAAPDASQDLQYYVTAQYSTWDNVPMPLAYTTTNTVSVVPYSAWGSGGLSVAGALNAQMNLASNQLWHGAVLVTNTVVAPSFRFQDSTNGWWGSASPKTPPAAGTATNGVQFAFTNSVASSLAFSFNEANRQYLIQSADFEPFTNGVLQAGWDATNVDFTASSAGVQGQGALTTNANAVVLSPTNRVGRIGIGDVSFWACMTNSSASSSYTVQKLSAGGTWETVGASGTISGGFYRYYRVGAGDPTATRARVLFGSAGVLVDEMVVTAAGAYVQLDFPTISTNNTPYTPMAATNTVVPVVGYGKRPILGITAAAQNGAGSIAVRVAYTSDSNPAETNELALIGSAAGGVFTNAMPALAVGTNRYWYTATYSGMSASPVRYPATGYYRYATDGTLGAERKPDIAAWVAAFPGLKSFIVLDGWTIQNAYLLDGSVQLTTGTGEHSLLSPPLDGVGTVYFKAKPLLSDEENHTLVVDVSPTGSGQWTEYGVITVPVSVNYTSFSVPVNRYGYPLYVRIRRTSSSIDVRNRLAIKDVVISPPPADVTVVEPSIISPGYPSEIAPITFFAQVAMKAGSTNYPASGFEPTLVWRWGSSGAWLETAMTNTAVSGRYAATLAPLSPGLVEYYYRVRFSGPSYTYVDSSTVPATVYDEGRSPAYLGWNGSDFTNSVQLCRQIPTARQFRVNMFESNHSTVELRRYDTQENTEMVLVGDHTWQGLLYLTNEVNMELQFAGTNTYVNGATAYGAVQSWGDTNQVTINPPLSGHASVGATNIVIQMNHLGFVMFRLNVTNGLYEVRRAAYQDFNEWQADEVLFEESNGLRGIKKYPTDFEGVAATVPARYMYAFDNETPDAFNPPYAAEKNVTGWRLENAWMIQERVSSTNTTAVMGPTNMAIRINAGAGTLQSTSFPNGRDAITFSHRVSFGDENTPYHRNGFTWTNYQFRANATVSEASPGNPTLSLIGYYYDRDNFYELRLTQERGHPSSNSTERVVGRVYRKMNGAYTPLGNAFTTNNVTLLGKTWSLSMTLNTTGSAATQISAYAGVVGGVTNFITSISDGSAGVLSNGGSVSFNVHDSVTLFSLLDVVRSSDGTPYPGFVNSSELNWYLGGTPLGASPPQPTRWVWGSGGTLTRPRPNVSFNVQIIQVGDALVLPNPPTWTPKASGTSSSLTYSTATVPIRTWDHTFVRIAPPLSDGMLMVDDLSTGDWRGVRETDPKPLPPNDPLGYTAWRGEEAYVTLFGGSKKLELTRSRANPASMQMLVSPVMENGVGTIAFTYQSTGGTSRFVVERNAYDALFEDGDIWSLVSEVEAPAGTSTNLFATIRVNMVGRLRIRMLPTSDPTASLWLDDIVAKDYPLTDSTTWKAYNALITPLQSDKAFEPDYSEHLTAYLNNSPTLDVAPNTVLGEDNPYIESPSITNGIGEIGFWYRAWNPTAEYPGKLKLMMADSPTSTNWVEVTLLDDPVADAAYKARLSNITNSAYEYFMIEISDTENKVLRFYSETNNADRVALDQIIVTEPVRSSIDILAVTMYPDIPLANDPVGVNVWLGNPRMDPYDIRVFLDYCLEGTNVWGVENWGSDPQLYERVELQQSPTNQFLYSTTPFTMVPPQPLDAVVQYRVVVTYQGKAPKPVEFTSFTNPDWYYPIDLNATFEDVGFSPYYFVFSCSTGTVFFNEFFYAYNSAYYNREYIEVIGPRNVSIANWKVDVVDAAYSATEDYVQTSYKLPDPSYLHGGTNGWGFYVLGDTDATISNRVDYYFPDGGNPLQSPVTSARLPINGGFRLVRGMGAYVDRISYGMSSIPANEMVARGYKYTAFRSTIGSSANKSIGLMPDSSGTNLTWQLVALGLETPGRMNPQEDEVLPIIGSDDVLQAALTLVITEIQVASGVAVVKANAASTNAVSDFTGWTGVLQTNALLELGDPGWGNTTSTVLFGTATNYTFGVALPVETMFFRIKASNALAP